MRKTILALTLLAGSIWARNVRVTWDPNQEADVLGYQIFMGTNTGVYQTNWSVLGRTNCLLVVSNLGPGTYYFAARAFTSNAWSDPSNEARMTIPAPSTGLGVTNESGVVIFGQLEAGPGPAGPYRAVLSYPGYVSEDTEQFFRMSAQIFNLR